MLASITPLGERGRNNRFAVTATAHVMGSFIAGAALGTALGALGMAARWALGSGHGVQITAIALLAVTAAAGVALDVVARGRYLPTIHHQVDERWIDRYRGWVYGAGFGVQLGAGVVTIVTASATYVTFVAALLSGSWAGGLLIGALFGLVRALPTLATAGVHDPSALVRLHRRLARRAEPARLAGLAVQTAVVLAAVAWALAL
jgi:hypothetical protein